MVKWIVLAFLSLSCIACNSGNVAPHMKYFAEFDNIKIELVDSIFHDIAKRNGLEVFEKERKKMRALSQNKNAFFTALYFKGDPVLILTNVGVAEKLVFTVTDYGEMPLPDLERVAAEIIKTIESINKLKFVRDDT